MNKTKKRLLALRLILGILIIANLVMIFHFSAQNGSSSDQTSGRVAKAVAGIIIKDYEEKSEAEQEEILNTLHPIIRKLAHMTEFGSLGALIFLLLLTWKNILILQYADALLLVLTAAAIDEYSQTLSVGRAAQLLDVGIDLLGAVICCSAILLFTVLVRRNRKTPLERKSL